MIPFSRIILSLDSGTSFVCLSNHVNIFNICDDFCHSVALMFSDMFSAFGMFVGNFMQIDSKDSFG